MVKKTPILSTIKSTVIADSVSVRNDRITTLELVMPRIILAEWNTHRKFSRNSGSSRAIPFDTILNQVLNDPFIPIKMGKNIPGMQAGEALVGAELQEAQAQWVSTSKLVAEQAKVLHEKFKVHKQVVNRLLEPYMWITLVVTSTEWDNFLSQRDHPDAEPHMEILAKCIRKSLEESNPIPRDTGDPKYDWHLPYLTEEDRANYTDIGDRIALSVAHCARTSYSRQGTSLSLDKAKDLFNRLRNAKPPHLSPLEHVAYPKVGSNANFDGWASYRYLTGIKEPFK